MSQTPQIILNQLSYRLPNEQFLFAQLNAVFLKQKTGLIGRNGLGKSTLFKLMRGELVPHAGSIHVQGTMRLVPQEFICQPDHTIMHVLGEAKKISALLRIQNGSIDDEDFAIVGEDWQVITRCQKILQLFELDYLDLTATIHQLSGGELTRLLLCQVFSSQADFILLDEPTNHLDIHARALLYNAIKAWPGGLIVISHDRALLNLMDSIVELTTLGMNMYGGNYEHYLQQSTIMKNAKQIAVLDAKKAMNKIKNSLQASKEKHEQKQSYGRVLRKSGSIDKMGANAKLGKSQRSQAKMLVTEERLLNQGKKQLDEAKAQIEMIEEIHIALPNTFVANNKMIIEIENVSFHYQQSRPLVNNFNFLLQGPERVALIGGNGCGKTTVLNLILSRLRPSSGTIYIGTERVCYLDQHASLLRHDLTLLENFLLLNPLATEHDAYQALASLLFKNKQAKKIVRELSGGEKLRAMLACVLLAKVPPQLLILDEPTNHLDLTSVQHVESALRYYQGAMIVVSHDLSFLEKITINRVISAPFVGSK